MLLPRVDVTSASASHQPQCNSSPLGRIWVSAGVFPNEVLQTDWRACTAVKRARHLTSLPAEN